MRRDMHIHIAVATSVVCLLEDIWEIFGRKCPKKLALHFCRCAMQLRGRRVTSDFRLDGFI